MSEFALLDTHTYIAGHDFTGDTNQSQLNAQATQLDATTYGSGKWTENAWGLKSTAFNMSGFWQSAAEDAVDPEEFAGLGVIDRVHTLAPTPNQGDPAFMFLAGHSNYQMFGQLGQLAPFTVQGQGSNKEGLVRGQLAKAKGAASATGVIGGGVNLGAVAANQFLYATWHVFTLGTTVTVQVESDDSSGFATPVARGTIGPVTARGGTWMTRVPGPITDTWFRFNITAITGAFVVAGAIGIGS